MTEKLSRAEWVSKIDPFLAEVTWEVVKRVVPTTYGPSPRARERMGICAEGTGTKTEWDLKVTYRGHDLTEELPMWGVWVTGHATRKSALATAEGIPAEIKKHCLGYRNESGWYLGYFDSTDPNEILSLIGAHA